MRKRWIIIIVTVVAALAVSVIAGSEYYTAGPQFCGLCHTPEKSYDSWIESGHKDAKCVDCHFAPGKESFLKAGYRGSEHLFAFLSPDAEAKEVQVSSKVSNLSCTTSQCHSGEIFLHGKVDLAENVPSTHKPHDDRIIEGKSLNCGTCHLNERSDEDYAVSEKTCYLCNGLNHIIESYF